MMMKEEGWLEGCPWWFCTLRSSRLRLRKHRDSPRAIGREAGHSIYSFMPTSPYNRIIKHFHLGVLDLLAAGVYACRTVRFVLVVRFVVSTSFRERSAAIQPEDPFMLCGELLLDLLK